MSVDVFAVIPARGGSKRVPNKNIRDVDGKPLIAHSIEQATAAETIDRAVVSTDDSEIAAIAREYGGDVPFKRPSRLATDEAKSPPVVEHALDWIESNGESPAIVAMLQVTTPLRTQDDIDRAIRMLRHNEQAESVISVTEYDTPPYWAVEQGSDGFLQPHFEEDVLWTDDAPRSQDLPCLFMPNGAIFAAKTEVFRNECSFYTDSTATYEMPPRRAIDIDEPFELKIVRSLFEAHSC